VDPFAELVDDLRVSQWKWSAPCAGSIPKQGHHFDDAKRCIEATQNLSAEVRYKVYAGNARRVYPRLNAALKA
jgi:4-oxalmesaconate hydratase